MTHRPMHETRPKEAGRLIGWTPETIANYIRDFAAEVTAELDRIEREMKELVPTCTTYRHQYTTAADLVKYSSLLTTDEDGDGAGVRADADGQRVDLLRQRVGRLGDGRGVGDRLAGVRGEWCLTGLYRFSTTPPTHL